MSVVDTLKSFVAQYGEGEHTSKAVFLFGENGEGKQAYSFCVKHAQRVGRGKFLVDADLIAKAENVGANKVKRTKVDETVKAAREEARAEKAREREAAKAEKAAAREAAKAEKAAAKEAKLKEREEAKAAKAAAKVKPATVKVSPVAAKARKDKKLKDISDEAVVLKEDELADLGFKQVEQDEANELHSRGEQVLVVNTSFSHRVACPPLASELVLKDESLRFYAKA